MSLTREKYIFENKKDIRNKLTFTILNAYFNILGADPPYLDQHSHHLFQFLSTVLNVTDEGRLNQYQLSKFRNITKELLRQHYIEPLDPL